MQVWSEVDGGKENDSQNKEGNEEGKLVVPFPSAQTSLT
jgi:hypothetical protein